MSLAEVAPFTGEPAGPPGAGEDEPLEVDGLVRLEATLTDAPDSEAAQNTVEDLRTAVSDVDADALVGGSSAQVRRICGRAIGGMFSRSNSSLSTTWSPAATHIWNSWRTAPSSSSTSAMEKS